MLNIWADIIDSFFLISLHKDNCSKQVRTIFCLYATKLAWYQGRERFLGYKQKWNKLKDINHSKMTKIRGVQLKPCLGKFLKIKGYI